MLRFFRRHYFVTVLLVVGVGIFGWVRYRMWGPYRDYRVDVAIRSALSIPERAAPLLVGAARQDITPDLQQYDPWTDANGNGKFEPAKGDTYEDRNHNGTFDFVWLGGFSDNRPAKGVNDPLWARALAFRHGKITVVVVTIDSVGITHERFIKIRKSIDHARYGITHILFSSTHTHNSPDTMGIWSYRPIFSKFDNRYLESVLEKTRTAILDAVANLQPVETEYSATDLAPGGFVRDSRLPLVYDRTICAARFFKAGTSETVATLVSWGNHPEAMGGDNPLISSDFVHYWRTGVEQGLPEPNGIVGLGGMCLYFQGPVGGLMTPLGVEVPDRNGRDIYRTNGVAKTRALGENLALRTVKSLREPGVRRMQTNEIAVVARTIFVPIEGNFKYPLMLGLIHPGWYDGKAKTEIDAIRIGELEILSVPGELYPEISEGGVEAPTGGDFAGSPREVPGLRSQMHGGVNMVFNLANDEVGYLIPYTQWDSRPPFTYGQTKAPYGEENSGGPDAATIVHHESLATLKTLHELLGER